jgi:hypothetical protein
LLEDIRTNGDAVGVYLAAGEIGNNSLGGEPAPNCKVGSVCNSAQKATHDLWVWEQMIDGNLETSGGVGTGGLVLPAMCVTGPVGGAAGIYQVTIVWRGSASITSTLNNICGSLSGNYGANNEFRRIIQIPTYIDPNS